MQRVMIVLAFVALTAAGVHVSANAQDSGPFARLAGNWSGGGKVELSNGSTESLRCRAAYDVLSGGQNVRLSIRCASDSYNFELRGSANYAGGSISGSWSEATRNATGTLSGRASGKRIDALAQGSGISAQLTLVTEGDRQTVTIRTQQESALRAATMTLRRGRA